MATSAQIVANQQNAQLSTGPVTPQGIAACKHNATRHGLTGKQIVIKGEDPAAYDQVRTALLDEHAPATESEAILVDDIAQNYWRLQRARRVEAEVVGKLGAVECILNPESAKAHQRLMRYLNTIERSWRKSCSELSKLQEARHQVEAEQAAVEAELAAAEAARIGSVLQQATTEARIEQQEALAAEINAQVIAIRTELRPVRK